MKTENEVIVGDNNSLVVYSRFKKVFPLMT